MFQGYDGYKVPDEDLIVETFFWSSYISVQTLHLFLFFASVCPAPEPWLSLWGVHIPFCIFDFV